MFGENELNKSENNFNGDVNKMDNDENKKLEVEKPIEKSEDINTNKNYNVQRKNNNPNYNPNNINTNGRNNNYNPNNINTNAGKSNYNQSSMNTDGRNNNYNQSNGNGRSNNYIPNNINANGKNNTYNPNNISATYRVEEERKKSSGAFKIIGITAAGLIIALGGGVIGGTVTQMMIGNKGSIENVVEGKNYAAPEFLNSSDGSLTVSEAFEKVAPAVVTISTKAIQQNNYGMFSEEVEGIGSGFIINEDGYILTNYHVIANSQQVTVLLSTGEEVEAKVINYDQQKDMAVIKLADGTKVPGIAELGDSDALYPGQDVVAIGTPLSKQFAQTCTKGIISAVSRDVDTSTGETMSVIQTDTAINPGNSGGPLINTKGQVIGINSMKLVEYRVEGIGFSIPINDAKDRIEALSKPILSIGITITEVTKETSEEHGYPLGLYVKGIERNSSAEIAGINIGDIITKFDGKEIKTVEDLTKIKEEKVAGDKVEVLVYRNGKNIKLELELTEG